MSQFDLIVRGGRVATAADVVHLQAQAMAQAIADAGDKVPVVAHRRNRGEWLAVLRLEDLITMLEGSP
ncbi:MAG: hypothetical protein IIA33_10060 [Planctomycetes bacterium]|nr:hypothetical protein [Planctomycetota bacterium]